MSSHDDSEESGSVAPMPRGAMKAAALIECVERLLRSWLKCGKDEGEARSVRVQK